MGDDVLVLVRAHCPAVGSRSRLAEIQIHVDDLIDREDVVTVDLTPREQGEERSRRKQQVFRGDRARCSAMKGKMNGMTTGLNAARAFVTSLSGSERRKRLIEEPAVREPADRHPHRVGVLRH